MDSAGAIIGLVVVAMVVIGGAAMAQVALEDTGEFQGFSETFNVSNTDTLVVLNQSYKEGVYYSDTVNVTNETGSHMIEGQDYEWHQDNGTLLVTSDSLVNNTATVDYSYRVPTEQQTQMASYLATLFGNAYALPFIFILLLVIIAGATLGGLR